MRVDKPLAFVRMNRSVSYCYICFTMIWTSEWNLHCQIHLDEVWHKVMQFGYNSVYVRFRYEWPGICPFCLEQGLVTQHNGHQLISHIHHMHLNKLESDGALSKCPCGDLDKLMSWNDLHDHMIDSHDIQLAAETVEKSVSTLLEPPPEDVEVVDTVDDLTTLPDVAHLLWNWNHSIFRLKQYLVPKNFLIPLSVSTGCKFGISAALIPLQARYCHDTQMLKFNSKEWMSLLRRRHRKVRKVIVRAS